MWMVMEQHNQNLYDRGDKNIIKKNWNIAFYNEKEQLYLETVTLRVGLTANILQAKDRE